jgi:hypothetical protein
MLNARMISSYSFTQEVFLPLNRFGDECTVISLPSVVRGTRRGRYGGLIQSVSKTAVT